MELAPKGAGPVVIEVKANLKVNSTEEDIRIDGMGIENVANYL